MAPLFELRGVRKRFGDKVVLGGIDLSIGRGETLVLLGPSGSGKTVLLKLLVRLLRADAGEVIFSGHDLAGLGDDELAAARRRIGFVFQGSALFDSLSVADNVAYALRVAGQRSAAEVAVRVQECLGLVGLPGAGGLAPQELSGGMRKRVAIARALATGPEALLYDEPTVGLDPANVRLTAELISELRQQLSNTGVVVTHDRQLALGIADRIALLLDGKIAWLGAAEEARARPPAVLAAFLTGRGVGELS